MGGGRIEFSPQGWELLETLTPQFHAVVAVGRMAMEGFWRRSGFPRFRRVAIWDGFVWAVWFECVERGGLWPCLAASQSAAEFGTPNFVTDWPLNEWVSYDSLAR